jgi:glycosyltransferase involved in cell wall biosynthesis
MRDQLLAKHVIGNPTLASVKEVAYVSTYPPRKCGIATFTSDLVSSTSQLNKLEGQTVIPIDGRRIFKSAYGQIQHKIGKDCPEDYAFMASLLNRSNVDVVNLQHEFGIFGGENGSYICNFLEKLEKPVSTTLHTVLPHFEGAAKIVFDKIVACSDAIVVMNQTTKDLLKHYGVSGKKVNLIPHGCPDMPLVPSELAKNELGLKNRVVLSTFGLLSRGKGIEYVIDALPEIISNEPKVVYYVLGATHPQVKSLEGETYRNLLMRKAKNLGVSAHVKFLNRFLSKHELLNYLQATDIYITPYLSPNQVSSGTLSYALGAGKAIVSTPYLHAKEALCKDRGLFCEFQDAESIAEKTLEIMENKPLRQSLEENAYLYSRGFTWPLVAEKYLELYSELTKQSKDEVQCGYPL